MTANEGINGTLDDGLLATAVSSLPNIETTAKLVNLSDNKGLALVLTVYGVIFFSTLFLIVLYRILNPKTDAILKNIDKSLVAFSSNLEGVSSALQCDTRIQDRLEHLEKRIEQYESVSKKNLIQYIRLIFKKASLHEDCLKNINHDKDRCPHIDNVICATVDKVKDTLKIDLSLYIMDDALRDKLFAAIDSFAQPDRPIRPFLQLIQDDLENLIK